MIRWPFCLRSTLEAEIRNAARLRGALDRKASALWDAQAELIAIKRQRSEASRKAAATKKANLLAADPIMKERVG